MKTSDNRYLCDLCFGEMNPKTKNCPHCNCKSNITEYPSALKEGTILAARYSVGRVLGKGGFGITYLCYDNKDGKKVAVKEFMPDSLAHRNAGESQVTIYTDERSEYFIKGVQSFYDEAELVSRFNGNPNIISVYNFFRENNTAYFTMEYLDGCNLKEYIKKNGGKISESETLYVLNKALDALLITHSIGILHRDIKPDNIYLCSDGNIKLIDFGAARQVLGEVSNSFSVILTQGYAPLEQYQRKGKQGPWTDIYALGATVYYSITGTVIDDAMSRIDDDSLNMKAFSEDFADIITKMLAVYAKDRYQNVTAVKEAFEKLDIVPVKPEIETIIVPDSDPDPGPDPDPDPDNPKTKKKFPLIPVIASSVAFVAILVAIILSAGGKKNHTIPDLSEKGSAVQAGTQENIGKDTHEDRSEITPENNPDENDSDENGTENTENEKVTEESTKGDEKTEETEEPKGTEEPDAPADTTVPADTTENEYTPSNEETVVRNLCGENVEWTIANGTLTISGTGKMYDYTGTNMPPYLSERSKITNVKIEKGVTSISAYAFYDFSEMLSVTIPDSVTYIGANAFEDCTKLQSVTIPGTVSKIYDGTFQNCRGLTSATLNQGTKSIGNDVFRYCSSLETVSLPSTLTEIGTFSFYQCKKLKAVTIPNGVTEIKTQTFAECAALNMVQLPSSLTKIGQYAFRDCPIKGELVLPSGVTEIGNYAFSGCKSITKITIPNGVKNIGPQTFAGWTNQQTVYFKCNEGDVKLDDSWNYGGNVNVEYDVIINSDDIWGSPTPTSNVISTGKCGDDVTWTLTDDGVLTISGSGEMYDYANNNTAPWYNVRNNIKKAVIEKGITNIGEHAFYNNTALEEVQIGNSVTMIEFGAFSSCTGLTKITIPDSVTIINHGAFSGCTGLTRITIPDSVTSIGQYAFSGCTGLTEITIPDSVTSIGAFAFSGCTRLTEINISNSVTSIGDYAFYGCTDLTKITIPDSVTSIGEYAFYGCTGLTEITIPDSVTSIEPSTFADCTGLTKITIPDSVTIINYGAFSGCTGLTKITIPDSVTSIRDLAFDGCTGLTEITIPDSVKSINYGAFSGCTGLTEITIPDSVKSINYGAFSGCTGLTEITIPDSVINIDGFVFYNCTNLKDIYVEGHTSKPLGWHEEWKNRCSATVHWNA